MSKISVELVDSMGGDLMVSNVARVSFNSWKEELDDKDVRLINYLADHGHSSPFRHPQIQLRCKAPIFIARQLQKHTIGLTWNEVSRRYVDVDVEFYIPDSWRSRPDNGIKQGSGTKEITHLTYTISPVSGQEIKSPIEESYHHLVETAKDTYRMMVEAGVAPEMARMVLPQSMMVSWIWTGSLQAFYHVYKLRSGEGAQKEAKDFATLLEDVVQPLFPNAWSALKGDKHDVETD